jgi:hypothetical protein
MTKGQKIAIYSVVAIFVVILLYMLLLDLVAWNYNHQKIPNTQ